MADLSELLTLNKIDVQRIFRDGGVQGGKSKDGVKWSGCSCPLCGDPDHFGFETREAGLWGCFKCNEKGNLTTFVAKTQRTNNGEAYKKLLRMAGVEPPKAQQARPPRQHSKRNDAARPEGAGAKIDTGRDAAISRDEAAAGHDSLSELPTADPALTAIYGRLIELAPLMDTDRAHLRAKRGFTDATIDQFRYRSGGPHMDAIVQQLRQQFAQQDLIKAGVLIHVNGNVAPSSVLLQPRVLVPYVDAQGLVYHIRCHKYGLEGIPLEPYCRALLAPSLITGYTTDHIVLTEGEFKSAALYQWGIPTLAVPGISSFGDANFDRLASLLREHGVRRITVIFDNEAKDDPNLPKRYKPQAMSRYDTQYWSYMMAYKLNREGFATAVGWLPGGWRDETGKVDFDQALATGRTRDEILAVIGSAVPHDRYLETLNDEARRVVTRKRASYFAKQSIRRDFNRYMAVRKSPQGNEYETAISNFVVNIKASYQTPEGVIRKVRLVNEAGEVSHPFELDPGSMAGVDSWRKFLLGCGNYIFDGTIKDLNEIWRLEFSHDSGEMIYMPGQVGRLDIDGQTVWMFSNMAIKNGKAYRPDDEGVFWIDGKGYKPQAFQLGAQGQSMEDTIPGLSSAAVNIKEITQRLYQAVGGYEAYLGIGWAIASIFAHDIFDAYHCVPILFAHGKRQSGKSTFLRWLMGFFGVESEGYGLSESTSNFIARALSYYSGLGCWFDEYKNEPRVVAKDSYLRSAYNRQSAGKGTATAFQSRSFEVNASLAISGEQVPKDNALYTRLVTCQISERNRNREAFHWLNKHASDFSSITREIVLNYDHHRDKLLATIAACKQALLEHDISDRTAENWAICAGAYVALVEPDIKFIQWVEQRCQEARSTAEEEHILNQFWEDVNTLVDAGKINAHQMKVIDRKLYVWLPAVYDTWAEHYRKKTGGEPFDKLSIQKYLFDEPYVLRKSCLIKMARTDRRVCEIDLARATDTIREIASVIEEAQKVI
jgi:hypothetical protein